MVANELELLKELREAAEPGGLLVRDKADEIFMRHWGGDDYNAKMHALSLYRRGWLDYAGNKDWLVDFDIEELGEDEDDVFDSNELEEAE